MGFDLLFKNFAKHVKLSSHEEQIIASKFEEQVFKKKAVLLKEGAYAKGTWFITQGVLRMFRSDLNGVEHISYFAPIDWWMGDMYSLISKKPSYSTIDALEPTTTLYLKEEDLEKLYAQIPKLERFFRIIVEKHLVSSQERLMDTMMLPAQERYIKFCERYPSLINTLPQKQIAAYIGVTPEFLSKIRGQYLRGGSMLKK